MENDDDWGRPSPDGASELLVDEEAQRLTVITPEDDAIMAPAEQDAEDEPY